VSDPATVAPRQPDQQRIILIIGPGRSGTSTMAGSLVKTGMQVPGRSIKGNQTNPSGFFEPRWVVDFHKRHLDRSQVGTLDASPYALERVVKATDRDKVRANLRRWLAGRLEEQERLVIKDPRAVWFRDLWVDAARDLGVEPGFVTMLRHPAEVSASRGKYYARARDSRRSDDTTRIGGWVNVALTSERITQGSPRAFVRYTDLVADWRQVLSRLEAPLGLTFEPALDVSPHPVDEFIDPTLHRVQVDWDDVEIPAELREIGERTWSGLTRLADEGEQPEVLAELEALRAEYLQLTEDALALSRHTIKRLESEAQRKGRRQAAAEAAQAAQAVQVTEPEEPEPTGLGAGIKSAVGLIRANRSRGKHS
jgi:hypothetical protein